MKFAKSLQKKVFDRNCGGGGQNVTDPSVNFRVFLRLTLGVLESVYSKMSVFTIVLIDP